MQIAACSLLGASIIVIMIALVLLGVISSLRKP